MINLCLLILWTLTYVLYRSELYSVYECDLFQVSFAHGAMGRRIDPSRWTH